MCIVCAYGFYLDPTSSHCELCSDLYPGCSSCTATACLDCLSNFFQSGSYCVACTDYFPGCSFCTSSLLCLSCQNGYFVNGPACEPCSTIDYCLYCTGDDNCTFCE